MVGAINAIGHLERAGGIILPGVGDQAGNDAILPFPYSELSLLDTLRQRRAPQQRRLGPGRDASATSWSPRVRDRDKVVAAVTFHAL